MYLLENLGALEKEMRNELAAEREYVKKEDERNKIQGVGQEEGVLAYR